jgi:hypothetical protein
MDWSNTGLILGVPVPPVLILGQPFESIVSNGKIGFLPPPPARTTIRNSVGVGIDHGAIFVIGTRTAMAQTTACCATRYATWMAHMDPSMSGEKVWVWWSTRTSTNPDVWTAFVKHGTATVDGHGDAFFHTKDFAAGTKVRVKFSFDGNATHGPAVSVARFALFN